MKPKDIQWCRDHFARMSDGGVWGLPACGLIFCRQGDELVLIDQMPHMNGMQITPKQLLQQQEEMFETTRRHFAAAQIVVRSEVPMTDLTMTREERLQIKYDQLLAENRKLKQQIDDHSRVGAFLCEIISQHSDAVVKLRAKLRLANEKLYAGRR